VDNTHLCEQLIVLFDICQEQDYTIKEAVDKNKWLCHSEEA
jgi:hypothetical protein